jgi:hypothetical protein
MRLQLAVTFIEAGCKALYKECGPDKGSLPMNVEQGLKFLSEEMRTRLQPDSEEDAKLVQKGMLLYRQGLVNQLKFESDQVYATVQDVTPVKVRLDLTFFDTSNCGCPNFGICRHRLAVFFAAYAQKQVPGTTQYKLTMEMLKVRLDEIGPENDHFKQTVANLLFEESQESEIDPRL